MNKNICNFTIPVPDALTCFRVAWFERKLLPPPPKKKKKSIWHKGTNTIKLAF